MSEITSGQEEGNFEAVVRQYGRLIRAVVARIGGPDVDEQLEDIEQQILVSLWKSGVGSEQNVDHPSSYIYRAAVRETVRALRRSGSRRMAEMEDRASPAPRPDRIAEHRELGHRIRRQVAGLRAERRRAVEAHLAGFGVREIMAMHGWSYQKARNLVARGLADLRQRLRQEGIDERSA